jgi:hypothetical protein
MSFSLSAPKTAYAGMIVLVLMASLPELVCCCDVSWGPGGLLGAKAACKQKCSAKSHCCCDPGGSENGAPQHGAAVQGCRCRFSRVSPAPVRVDRGCELDLAPCGVTAWIGRQDDIPDSFLSTVGRIDARASHPLTSAHHCALLQTWLI